MEFFLKGNHGDLQKNTQWQINESSDIESVL